MPMHEATASSKRFHRQLRQIRANIETLPEEQRSHFRLLADQAEQRQSSMEDDCARIRDMVDDMRLTEASVKFDLWVAADKIKRLCAFDNHR